jgi:hypothetical protein
VPVQRWGQRASVLAAAIGPKFIVRGRKKFVHALSHATKSLSFRLARESRTDLVGASKRPPGNTMTDFCSASAKVERKPGVEFFAMFGKLIAVTPLRHVQDVDNRIIVGGSRAVLNRQTKRLIKIAQTGVEDFFCALDVGDARVRVPACG